MVAISPEKNGYWPPVEARNQFSASYHGSVFHDHESPSPRYTDAAYILLKKIADEHEYKPPQKFSIPIPQSMYTTDTLGELMQRWEGEGKAQEVVYLDENNKRLYFNTTSHEDMATRLKIRHVIRKLKYYRAETQENITIVLRDETVAEIHTFLYETNNNLTEFATPANSEPELHAVGTTQEELETHVLFINRFLTLSTEARTLTAKTDAHFSQEINPEESYSRAVTDLFDQARNAVEKNYH